MAEAHSQKDLTGAIAQHYNELQESDLKARGESRIFYQRNFNNWIKSMAIGDTLAKVKENSRSNVAISVLDLAAGKGGDLLKWKIGRISQLVCADIAATSLEQYESRYKEQVERMRRDRGHQNLFTAEFIAADCTKQRLKDLYKDPNTQFDIVSCQFAFHYCFESFEQAEMMLQNACECLKPGGYFIGTTPDSYQLVQNLRSSDSMSFGSEVHKITFEVPDKENLPLFGAKYHFQLDNVVNCPEFLVFFPLLEKMAEKHNMKLIYRKPFAEFFKEHIISKEGRDLIGKMSALESYPPDADATLVCKDESAYLHAKQSVERVSERSADDPERRPRSSKVGTLSQPEWEVCKLYVVFAFQKQSSSESSDPSRKRKLEETNVAVEEDPKKTSSH